MSRFLMTLRFDGTAYHGWQVQKNAVTVQSTVQNALESALKIRPDVTGCSRTDSGVHAGEYCFHFDFDGNIPPERLTLALDSKLPDDIAAIGCRRVGEDFHARYSVKSKQYVYRIYTGKYRDPFLSKYAYRCKYALDAEQMNAAAAYFIGTHDFTSFCASGSSVEDNVRTVFFAQVCEKDDIIEFSVEADGFLYNMVRIMAGTLMNIGAGRISARNIQEIILKKDRSAAGFTAPPHGLFLNKVTY